LRICYILLSGARPKRRCTHSYLRRCFATLDATGAETSLLLTALNSPHPIHTVDGHYTRNSKLHHFVVVTPQSQNIHISYHKNGLVTGHQSVYWWRIFYVFCSKNIVTKPVGYQQPTCLCVKMEFVFGVISLSCELYSLSWSYFRSRGIGRVGLTIAVNVAIATDPALLGAPQSSVINLIYYIK